MLLPRDTRLLMKELVTQNLRAEVCVAALCVAALPGLRGIVRFTDHFSRAERAIEREVEDPIEVN